MEEKILQYTQELEPYLIKMRRDFHAHPEQGWEEIRTSAKIAETLQGLGFQVLIGEEVCKPEDRMGLPSREVLEAAYERALAEGTSPAYAERMKGGRTGVIGILEGDMPGPTIAMRFDIDALPILESDSPDHVPAAKGFASKHKGTMHACGHDGHIAVGLGVAHQLAKHQTELRGKVKLIFQPAEEGVRGAKSIVSRGHLSDVDYFLAAHVAGAGEDKGCQLYPGSGGALATTKMDVVFHGKSTHAAGSPQLGNNANLAMSTAVQNLYAISRHSDGVSRVNVGAVHSYSGRNVIADSVTMQMETRGSTTEINEYMKDYALRIVEHSAKMHGCTSEVSLAGEAFSMESDEEMMEIVRHVAGTIGMKIPEKRLMHISGSEDVSYMMKEVQDHGGIATFMWLLTPTRSSAHSVDYDFDEGALTNGVNIFTATVFHLMHR